MTPDDRSDEQKAADFAALSEDLQRASLDLQESIIELSAYYAASAKATNAFEWLRDIGRCEIAAQIVSQRFAALREAILKEPFKRG